MIRIVRTNAENLDFIDLVTRLDADLGQRDGEEHNFYHQYNGVNTIKHAVVAFLDNKVIGCGALKKYNKTSMEVKRMYVCPAARGNGFASEILKALEEWAFELGYRQCVLETGKRQPEAISLYIKNNYEIIPNYPPYIGVENSVCFQKNVSFYKI